MVDPRHKQLSVARQCELLDLPRSSYYRRPRAAESDENLELIRVIDEEYTAHPFLDTRKMVLALAGRGSGVNRKRVQRLMRKMGLRSVAPKPNPPSTPKTGQS